jgi:DNA polymerase elongation subunit (family B)
MEVIDSDNIKRLKEARKIIDDLQRRLYRAENCMDDLTRAIEIAQYTKQYHATEPFVADATRLLEDRLVIPDADQSNAKYTVVEGSIDQEVFDDLSDTLSKKGVTSTGSTQIGIDRDLKATGNTVRNAEVRGS